MTFPSSLLGATSRAQVDGLDPADGSKTSGHRYTWSVYKLSRQRIERIEHRARPGQDRVRLSPAPARAHLESINFDVRPSVHSGRLRGPSGLGPTPRTGTHGVVLHFEIIAHYTFSCPAQWATSRRPAPGARGAPCRSRTSLLTVSKSRNAHVTRRPYQELLDLPSSKFDFGGGIDVQRLVTAPRACSMHSIRTPAPPVGDRRCVARTARRTTDPQDHRPATFSRESRAEKLEESPEGRIDCVRCEVVPPPKPAQRARTTGGLVRRRVSALHTAPDHGEGAHPHSRTLNNFCLLSS